ncbi:MAG TPA: hypothetical protein VLA83_18370 [Candidatus Binatia bacterium]|nr:hypothetical protein [Candidatus Binatia bacterium]
MANKLSLACSLLFLAVTCPLQQAHGQIPQLGSESTVAATADQDAHEQPTQASSTNKTKAPGPVAADQSSTVGDPTSFLPLNVKGKLRYFAVETFRPGIYPVAAVYDGLTLANPPKAYPREWRQGFPAFARNYGDFMASWAAVQGGKFVAASILHEDPRYFISTNKNFFARVFNTVRYAVIDRSDSGHPRLAVANLAGAFAGGFVGNAYLPDPYANASHGFRRSAFALTGFVTSNLADEFHPEIHRLAKKVHLPF